MCISFWPVEFSGTITGTIEVLVDNVVRHVLWYQNVVGVPSMDADGETTLEPAEVPLNGNCLLIPLMGSWESIRLLNTADTPNLLKDVRTALQTRQFDAGAVRGLPAGRSAPEGRIVFLQFDIYDIVIAENAGDLARVVEQITPRKRPSINEKIFERLEQWYQCPVALCCFDNNEGGEAKPIAFAFEPKFPDKLTVYTLDAHDGNPPDPDARVRLDHTVFVGSYLMPKDAGEEIHYKDSIPYHLRPYVLNRLMGTPLTRLMLNGDIEFDIKDVRAGKFDGRRRLPHGAGKQHAKCERVYRNVPHNFEHWLRTAEAEEKADIAYNMLVEENGLDEAVFRITSSIAAQIEDTTQPARVKGDFCNLLRCANQDPTQTYAHWPYMLDKLETTFGQDSLELMEGYRCYAVASFTSERDFKLGKQQAAAALDKALAIIEKTFGPNHVYSEQTQKLKNDIARGFSFVKYSPCK